MFLRLFAGVYIFCLCKKDKEYRNKCNESLTENRLTAMPNPTVFLQLNNSKYSSVTETFSVAKTHITCVMNDRRI